MLKKLIVILLSLLLIISINLSVIADADKINILIIGTDASLEKVTLKNKLGRADAIYVASLDTKSSEIKLLSIERDYLVDLGKNGGKNKLATSTYFGNVELCISKVNELLDLSIDSYVQIDISGVIKAIDLIGGVDVELSPAEVEMLKKGLAYTAKEEMYNNIKEGLNTLNGTQAYAYIRLREQGDNIDDITSNALRNNRHMGIFKSLLNKGLKLKDSEILTISNEVLEVTNTNLSVSDILDMVYAVRNFNNESIKYARSPMTEFERTRVGLHRVVVPKDIKSEIDAVKQFLSK